VLLTEDMTDVARIVPGAAVVSGVAFDAAGADRAYFFVGSDTDDLSVAYVELAESQGTPYVDLTRAVVEVSEGEVLPVMGRRRLSPEARSAWTAFALSMVAADEIGIMAAAVEMMTEYAKSRRQFKEPIGKFQAVSHPIVDAYVTLEGARSIVWYAAWAVDNSDAKDALESARRAKAYTAIHTRATCEALIQVLGGIGMTWEHRAHLYLRRAMVDRLAFGDEHHHLGALTDLLLEA
jgi:alkylation response protein AidB-like acyl-CoA dehydrogenase